MELCKLAQRICAFGIIGSASLALVGCGGQSALDAVTPGSSVISKTYASETSSVISGVKAQAVLDILGSNCPSQNSESNYLYMPLFDAIGAAAVPHDYFGVLSGNCDATILKKEGLIAMPATAIGSVASLYGDYTGFIGDGSSATVHSIATTISGNNFIATTSDSVSANVNFTAVDSPSAGFIQGNVDGRGLVCMGSAEGGNTGKTALFCLIENPADPTKPLNLVLASK